MSKDNFDLLQVMIRKTLDDTHKKDVLDYFKKGKISEKERDELLEYLKMINGIVLKQESVHKDKSKFTGYYGDSGWKIHLAVEPKNYQCVFRWLFLTGPYDYKHLHGGEAEAGKDFTVWIGSWDDMFAFAGVIEKEIGDRLKEFDQTINFSDLYIYPHIAARFQLAKNLQYDFYDPKLPHLRFSTYGRFGASFLWADVNVLNKLQGLPENSLPLKEYSKYMSLYGALLAVRGYKELGKMFGDYFLGKRRPNLLSRFFAELEKKHGSELPKPGKSTAARIL